MPVAVADDRCAGRATRTVKSSPWRTYTVGRKLLLQLLRVAVLVSSRGVGGGSRSKRRLAKSCANRSAMRRARGNVVSAGVTMVDGPGDGERVGNRNSRFAAPWCREETDRGDRAASSISNRNMQKMGQSSGKASHSSALCSSAAVVGGDASSAIFSPCGSCERQQQY